MDKHGIARDVVRTLLREHTATRKSLVARLEVRPATLIEVVRRQADRGLLDEPERKGKRTGRRVSPICLRKDYAFFAGLNLDIDRTEAVLMDAQGTVVEECAQASSPERGAEGRKKETLELLERLRRRAGPAWKRLRGIGFADPGLVDVRRGVSLKAVNVPGWKDVPVRQWLGQRYSAEVEVCPQCQAQAYAEHVHAKASPEESLFYLHLDWGVGGGFVQEGALRVGDSFCGMEIGHVVVEEDGPICQCGNRGCLEAVAGIPGIRRRIEDLVRNGVETELGSGDLGAELFVKSVKEGDKAAHALALEISEYVGAGLAMVVALLNPSVIVIGGRLSGMGELLLSTVRRVLSLRCLPMALEHLACRISELPEGAAARGAALLVREKVLLQAAA